MYYSANKIRGQSILFSISDINVALDSLKSGNACGVDGLMFAHRITYVFLSLLFNVFNIHGYLPADFMRTAMVPIIKNKTGDSSDKNNYRPIALVAAASKLFEICNLEVLETYLLTHDHQFGLNQFGLSISIPQTCAFSLLKAWINTTQVKIHLFTPVC